MSNETCIYRPGSKELRESFMEARKNRQDIAGVLAREFYPRRIVPPGPNWIHPADLSTMFWSEAVFGTVVSVEDDTQARDKWLKRRLMGHAGARFGMPMYFAASEFARAAMRTTLPSDHTFSDIKLPMLSLWVLLEKNVSQEMFGWWVPYIGICRLDAGSYDWPNTTDTARLPRINVPEDRFLLQFVDIRESGMWIPWESTFATQSKLHEILYSEDDYLQRAVVEAQELKMSNVDLSETRKAIKVHQFIWQLLAIMNTRPDAFVTPMQELRKARCKGGKMVDDLWSPNIVGKDYRSPSRPVGSEDSAETGIKVRTHWRRGHLHTVLFGSARSKSRLDWFEPVLVNAPDKAETNAP